jgi:hypothetical protein
MSGPIPVKRRRAGPAPQPVAAPEATIPALHVMPEPAPAADLTHFEWQAARCLARAREIARQVETWADYAQQVFHPRVGLIATTFPDRDDKIQFRRTAEYAEIDRLLGELKAKFGVFEGMVPRRPIIREPSR